MAKENDVAKYEFDGVKYTQTYLTINEFENIAEIFESFDLKETDNAMKIFLYLKRSNKLDEFFNIILKGESPVDVGGLSLAQVVEVIQDFLSCNNVSEIVSKIVSMLGTLGEPLGINLKALTNSTGTN